MPAFDESTKAKSVCRPGKCPAGSILLSNGTCEPCAFGFKTDEKQRNCLLLDCTKTSRIGDKECIPCPSYERQDPTNRRKCVRTECTKDYKLLEDGTCGDCPKGTFSSADDRTVCLRPNCPGL